MIPYDSFLIDPFLLALCGIILARLAVFARPMLRGGFLLIAGSLVLACFWATSVALYFDLEAVRWIWEMCGADSGRDWMINSGVFDVDVAKLSAPHHVLAGLAFATYPVWFALGLLWGVRFFALKFPHPIAPRWRGQNGRIETWYATFTDAESGNAYWIHGERRAPKKGASFIQGWIALFPADGTPPRHARFGPEPATETNGNPTLISCASARFSPALWEGRAGGFSWRLEIHDDSPPLFAFPRAFWEAEILPACACVPYPQARFYGGVSENGRDAEIRAAAGALGHVYGRTHAAQWGWLHADLGGDGILEIVAALSPSRGLKLLGPLVFLRWRRPTGDFPSHPFLAALAGFKAVFSEPRRWSVSGTANGVALEIEVGLPNESSLTLEYENDGKQKVFCRNSERAKVTVSWKDGDAAVKRRELPSGAAHGEFGWRE